MFGVKEFKYNKIIDARKKANTILKKIGYKPTVFKVIDKKTKKYHYAVVIPKKFVK